MNSMVDRAAALLNGIEGMAGGDSIFSSYNGGVASQNTSTFLQRLPSLLANIKPDIVVLHIYSPNDDLTDNGLATTRMAHAIAIESIIQSGAIPILSTGVPLRAGLTGFDAGRRATIEFWRKNNSVMSPGFRAKSRPKTNEKYAPKSGYTYIADTANATSGPVVANIAPWKSGYTVDDTHPSDLAISVMANVIKDTILQIYGR